MENILLHTCCGICAFCTNQFLKDNFNIKYYWYNPNIHPIAEYNKRLLSAKAKYELVEDTYDWRVWFTKIKGFANDDNKRCTQCWLMRLTNTLKKAKELKINYFSTTLLISPYQKHDVIKKICEDLEKEYKVTFYYFDERKSFYKFKNEYKTFGLYMQKYCGCVFSK